MHGVGSSHHVVHQSSRIQRSSQVVKKPPSLEFSYSIIARNTSLKQTFFFENLEKYYLDLNDGHEKFQILNAEKLQKDAIIEKEVNTVLISGSSINGMHYSVILRKPST